MKRINITRHGVIVITCVVLVFAAGIVANKVWNHHQAVVAAAEQRKQDDTASKARIHSENVRAATARVKAECTKETGYYNLLTASQKKTQAAPNCASLPAIQ